jgi:hypothetical protein
MKRVTPITKAHLTRGASYMLLLLAICLALFQT